MTMLPGAVPEIQVVNVDAAVDYYVQRLGFTHDWGGEEGGAIAGISSGACRLFLTHFGPPTLCVFWLNLDSKGAVDALFAEWKSSGADVVSAPEDKPWNLREFTVKDLDGNRIRVFHDFSRD